jgi:hypothetical protein
LAVVSSAMTLKISGHFSGLGVFTCLFSDMERKVLRVLLSIPGHVVEVQVFDVAVLKVLYCLACLWSRHQRYSPVRPTRLYAK